MKSDIIEYLENLDWPIEQNTLHSMSLTTLKNHIRSYYDYNNKEMHSEAKTKAKEECVIDFIGFLINNKICHINGDIIYGIGKISSTKMTKIYGYSKNPNHNSNTYFAGKSSRSLLNPFNPED